MARVMKDFGLELSDYAQTVECDDGKGEVVAENVSRLDADLLPLFVVRLPPSRRLRSK